MTDLSALQSRLVALRAEKTKGEEMLAHLDRERQTLREQILRIDGAIRVLEELVDNARDGEDGTDDG